MTCSRTPVRHAGMLVGTCAVMCATSRCAAYLANLVTTTLGRTFGRLTIEPSLAWLLAPLTVETFLDKIWTATHYHVKRHCAGFFDSLLHGPSAVEELLELFRREPSAVRLMRGNDKKRGADSSQLADGSLDLVGIRNDFADGFTIVVDGVERYARAIASLAYSIEVELNFPIQVNGYITPPGSRGLVPHYDDHDVLILQIQGSKIWHLYNGVDIPPHEMQRRDKEVPTDGLALPTDLRLEVGDVLYLPRGLVHAADTDTEPSIHLTVGIHAPTALTLAVGTLHSLSFHDDRLNARLPPRYLDDADVHAALGVLMRDAVRTVEDPRHRGRSRRTGRCPGPPRPMPTGRTDLERRRNRRTNTGDEVPTALFAGEGGARRRCAAVCHIVDKRRCRPRIRRDAVHLEKR